MGVWKQSWPYTWVRGGFHEKRPPQRQCLNEMRVMEKGSARALHAESTRVPCLHAWDDREEDLCVCVCVSGRGRGAAEAHMPRFVRVREQHDHCHSGDFGFLSMHLNFKRKRTKTVRHFSTTHPLPLAATNLFSVYHWAWCLCTYVCVYVRLDSVSFSDWLISLPDNAGKVHPYCRKW